MAQSISQFAQSDNLFFFDAVAPIISVDSIDMDIAYWGSRFGKGNKEEGDYLNCPFDTREDMSILRANWRLPNGSRCVILKLKYPMAFRREREILRSLPAYRGHRMPWDRYNGLWATETTRLMESSYE
jgi:hypothetical protein